MNRSSATAAISGYTPLQIRTAYGLNSTTYNGSLATGAGETIAIVDAYNDPDIYNDLDAFDEEFTSTSATGQTLYAQYGAASSFLTVYNQSGQVINVSSTSVPTDSTGGWEMEEALDVEWAHAIAPGAKIILVEANSSGNDLYTAVQTAASLPGVSVVSMSWGSSETSGQSAYDSVFTTPAGHQGVTFVASTGDSSAGEYPAFSSNVVAVGGTTLTLNSSDGIQSETAWSTGSDSWATTDGTGGGTSSYETEPAYQDGVQSTGYRTIPDVSWDADPSTGVAIYDSYKTSSSWIEIGGTSVGAPSFSGVIAVANEERTLEGLGTLNSSSNSQQALDAVYSLPSSDFHDITSGHITANGKTYYAGVGYDEVSGLGSPVASLLIAGLANYGTSSPTATQLAFATEPPTTASVGAAFTVVVQLENSTGEYISDSGTSVTLTLSSGTFSAGSNTMTATTNSSGQASFSMTIDASGTYTLTASSGGLTSATSTSFSESVPVSQLAFTSTLPDSVSVGTSFISLVQLESSTGSFVSQSGVNVTLTLLTGTFSNGSSTMTATTNSSGQASFSVIVTAVGTFSLEATSSGLTGTVTASSFQVTSSAVKLAFTTEPPASVTAGAAITTVVQLENSSNAAVDQSGVTITLTLSSGTFSTGNKTVTAVTNSLGQASFSVTVSTASTVPSTFAASSPGLTGATSSSFLVTSPSSKLVFTMEPPSSLGSGTVFTTVIQLENSNGNIAQSGVTVTVTLWSGTGAQLATGMGVTNNSGQVAFTVSVNTPGNGYTLTASAPQFTSAQSTQFNITSGRGFPFGGPANPLPQSATSWEVSSPAPLAVAEATTIDFWPPFAIGFSDSQTYTPELFRHAAADEFEE